MSVAAVLLAAGGSRRMGRPKQLLAIGGETLLRRAARTSLAAGLGPVVAVLGAMSDRLREELFDLSVNVIDNPNWEWGPGTSVRAGMTAVDGAEAVVFLLCDQPFVDAQHLQALVRAWRETGQPMAASAYAGTHGAPALFDASCFADLRDLPPESGAKKLLLARPDRVASVPFPTGAWDVDTQADFAQARFRCDRRDSRP